MGTESDIITSALLCIEHQCRELEMNDGALLAPIGQRHSSQAGTATTYARRVLRGLETTVTTLKDLVLTFDHEVGGTTVESLGELAVRAETVAVLLQLDQLEVLRGATARAQALGMFVGRFKSFDDVAAFVLDKFAEINRAWLRYRRLDRFAAIAAAENGPRADERRALLRCAVQVAQLAIGALRRDPDFNHFLAAGMALVDWPTVHTACTNIARVLEIEVDTELAPALFGAAPDPDLVHSHRVPERHARELTTFLVPHPVRRRG